jgi:hypothetical protein
MKRICPNAFRTDETILSETNFWFENLLAKTMHSLLKLTILTS